MVNQIDHLIVNSRSYSNIIDVRSYRAACHSNHYLVRAKQRERIANTKKKSKEILTFKISTKLKKHVSNIEQ